MITGDFNDFASHSEKRQSAGSSSLSSSQDQRRINRFSERMNNCQLIDLGCSGPRLTWTNNRQGWANTMVRLDKTMCNSEWKTSFPEGLVRNLPRTYSDHSPMMIFTQGKIKLNVDGSRKLGGGGGFGGVFRDEHGAWVCGYYGRLDSGTSLEAELWALYKGLAVMLQKDMHEVIIETDAKQVVQLMEDVIDDKFPFKGLLEDAKIIFRGCECTIHHIYKEGNLCADPLAKFGAEQPKDILVVNDPPQEIQCYLVADMIGLSRERN
ncbi:unnamed protein product [Camellia sinensis]